MFQLCIQLYVIHKTKTYSQIPDSQFRLGCNIYIVLLVLANFYSKSCRVYVAIRIFIHCQGRLSTSHVCFVQSRQNMYLPLFHNTQHLLSIGNNYTVLTTWYMNMQWTQYSSVIIHWKLGLWSYNMFGFIPYNVCMDSCVYVYILTWGHYDYRVVASLLLCILL